ncbi:MAG: DegT/DnrJ/EryC1/StrS aminotransferase family protein [Planctomycetota bacterium]
MFIKHSYPSINQTTFKALSTVLRSGYIAQGKIVKRFEQEVVKYSKGKNINAIAVNSGSSALHLALLSLGVSTKDEVIIPSYVCSAVLNAVNYTDAKPIIADINDYDLNLNIQSVKNKITKRTRAIIVSHLFGFPAEIDKFLSLKIPIIEDCAQSIGATYKNNHLRHPPAPSRTDGVGNRIRAGSSEQVGTFGKLAVFSFYATKMLTTGYGGMIISKDKKLVNYIRDLINYDNRDNYIQRYNYQMSDISAALGISQLNQLDRFIHRRREIALQYTQTLQSLKIPSLILPKEQPNTKSIFYRYVIRHPAADEIILQLNRCGIETKHPIYKPLHHYLKLNNKDFPVTEKNYRATISIPIYPSLTNKQINYITHTLFKILKRLK